MESKNTMTKVTVEEGASLDIVSENLDALKIIFPEAFTEDGVNFETLRQLLGDEVDEGEEKYGLNWHGKKKARQIALTPSTGTLRPCTEESVDWDSTQNLFIEGDNLEVLKLLQKSYAGRVKMIYIDPPYNTGKEFIYPDKFQDNLETYLRYSGQIDDEGMKFSSNTEASGRKHTNWLNMMYPRLKLGRNLLSRSGIIFISIGQDEIENLVFMCDEIFGEENLVSICSRVVKTGGQKGIHFSPCVDYIVGYAKNIGELQPFREEISQNVIDKVYTKVETEGPRKDEKYRSMGLYQAMLDKRANQRFYIECPDGNLVIPPGDSFPDVAKEGEQVSPKDGDGVWRWTYARYEKERNASNILFIESDRSSLVYPDGSKAKWNVYYKIWLKDRMEDGQLPGNILTKFESQHASSEMKKLGIPFDFPKPSALIKFLMSISGVRDEDIVMDFFAGSCPLGHAAMELAAESQQLLRFICVQLPEKTGESSAEHKAGYKTIADIGKARIRSAAAKIKEENPMFDSDFGFKVFKLNSSNIIAWNPDKSDLEQTLLDHTEHLVEGRTEEDILYELLLKRGVDLTVPIEEKEVEGKAVYSIGFGVLFACLDTSIDHDEVESLAQGIIDWHKELDPATDTQVVFRDSAFADDIAKTNMTAILEQNGIAHVRSL